MAEATPPYICSLCHYHNTNRPVLQLAKERGKDAVRWQVESKMDGARLSDFLRRKGFSAALLKRVKFSPGGLWVNGEEALANRRLCAGDEVEVRFPPEAPSDVPESDLPLSICFEDDHYLVADKPAGLVVHPTAGHHGDTLAGAYMALMHRRGEAAPVFRPLYRLDKNTSGALLLAKTAYGASAFPREVQKEYLALAQGLFAQPEGEIDLPIAREEGSIIRRTDSPKGRPSRTHYRVLAQGGGLALLRVRLLTGRTHQIRVHLSAAGYPLAGDTLYGGDGSLLPRQALHCALIGFHHPLTGRFWRVQAGLPADFAALCREKLPDLDLKILEKTSVETI